MEGLDMVGQRQAAVPCSAPGRPQCMHTSAAGHKQAPSPTPHPASSRVLLLGPQGGGDHVQPAIAGLVRGQDGRIVGGPAAIGGGLLAVPGEGHNVVDVAQRLAQAGLQALVRLALGAAEEGDVVCPAAGEGRGGAAGAQLRVSVRRAAEDPGAVRSQQAAASAVQTAAGSAWLLWLPPVHGWAARHAEHGTDRRLGAAPAVHTPQLPASPTLDTHPPGSWL